ncbi:MAG: amino acid adenylation domain-containing protein, partial [Acidobacteriota bacterium]
MQSTALLRFESRLLPIGTSRFDFGLQFEPTATGLIGTIEYSTDLFDAITIERWSDHLLRVLRGAVEHPHAKLSELPLLAPSMRHQVLIEWQGQEISRPPSHLIERFATWVERTPDAVAVVDDGGVLTYGALDHRADRLARRLLAARLGPAPVVGVLLERSPATVVALLAILKAGGTFLALDPEDPEDRLRWLIDDAGVQALLTSESIRSTLCPVFAAPTRAPAPTVLRVESAVEPAGPSRPLPEIAPQQPAYLIYTSGSTGRPKAVVVPHSALAHVLTVRGRHVTPLDSKLHKTALSFDVALAEIFLPLFCGGRTVLARPGGQHDPAYLNLLIVRERITLAVFSPAQLASLLTEGGLSNAPTLRTVGVGGEAVPADLPGRFFARSTADLYNRYGPSEATIFMTEWHCRHGETLRSLPIGRPLPGVAALLLDDGLQPVPVGVPGELHVAGPTLATGYLGRPARTAAAFIPAPHGDAGDRLYRTGDLARTCGDGALEFLGRRDHQVKVRGFRIELGEVEAALIDHADVHEAAVTVRDDLATGPALVAWLVTGAGHTVATEALKRYLGDRLPHYMMPTFVVPLPELPRTLAGKVDRAALEKNPLTDRETAGTKTDQTPLPPQGQIEQAIAAIFAEILEVERPGLDVNFFDLGGHSLLMPRLQRHLQEAFGRQIPIVDLFRRPTIASLAALLGGHPSENSGADLDERSARQENLTATDRSREPIAIIGLSGRFPGAASPA